MKVNKNRKNHNFQVTYRGHYILEIPELKYKHLAYCCEGEPMSSGGGDNNNNPTLRACFADCPCQPAGEIHTHCILVTIDPISINQLYQDLLPFLKPGSDCIEGGGGIFVERGREAHKEMNMMLVEEEEEEESILQNSNNCSGNHSIQKEEEEEELWMDIRCYKHWQTMFHQHIGLGTSNSSRPSCGSNLVWITTPPYQDVQSYQLQVRQHQPTALKNQLILAYGPLQAVQKGLIPLYQYSQLKKSYSEYLNDLEDLAADNAEPIKPGPKKRHYWLYGDSNTGKTTWCINQANQLSQIASSSSSSLQQQQQPKNTNKAQQQIPSSIDTSLKETLLNIPQNQLKKKKANTNYFMVPRNNDWCFYNNQKHIIIDEFDGTLYTISQLQEMVDAKCFTVNTKGGSQLLTPDVIFYITSRHPPEGCYREYPRESRNLSHHHSTSSASLVAAHKQDVQGLYNRFFVHQMTFVYPSSTSYQLPSKATGNRHNVGDNRGKMLVPQYGFQVFNHTQTNREEEEEDNANNNKVNIEEEEDHEDSSKD